MAEVGKYSELNGAMKEHEALDYIEQIFIEGFRFLFELKAKNGLIPELMSRFAKRTFSSFPVEPESYPACVLTISPQTWENIGLKPIVEVTELGIYDTEEQLPTNVKAYPNIRVTVGNYAIVVNYTAKDHPSGMAIMEVVSIDDDGKIFWEYAEHIENVSDAGGGIYSTRKIEGILTISIMSESSQESNKATSMIVNELLSQRTSIVKYSTLTKYFQEMSKRNLPFISLQDGQLAGIAKSYSSDMPWNPTPSHKERLYNYDITLPFIATYDCLIPEEDFDLHKIRSITWKIHDASKKL